MQAHNEAGHINAFIKDHDSAHTGYGQHDRVVAFQPSSEGLYVRVDHKWKLGMPTIEQVLIAAMKTQGIKGKWKFSHSEMWDDETSTDMYFVKD